MEYKKWILKLLPVIIVILVLIFLWTFWKSELLSSINDFRELLIDFRDYGNILSLIAVIVVLYLCDYHKMVIKNIQMATDSAWRLIFILLGFIGLIGIWFALRAVGFTILKFILSETELYSVENIFNVVSFLLIANYCFTLLRTFKEIGTQTNTENDPSNRNFGQKPIVPKIARHYNSRFNNNNNIFCSQICI